jgi:hypothetical protein
MGCNCKNAVKISEANTPERSGVEKALLFLKKVGLFMLAISLSIVLTPIILIGIFYKMIFDGNKPITMPNKILNMLK